MYSIRQFRPTFYFLLLLGVTGFSIAVESPGLWLLAAGGICINAWLIKTRRFLPIPRLAANIITLGALGFTFLEVRGGDATPIITVGEYIVFLHLVKLFEQRANRDFAQLLVLSLLLMVAAAISTASLLFGIVFIIYMFLSLYCCLLFHLKMETDRAQFLFSKNAQRFNAALLQQDQRDLPHSMRRLATVISLFGIAMGVVVFLFFPRGAGQGMLNPVQSRAGQTLTGFSDQVSFQKVAQITQSNEVVAWVELYDRDQRVVHPTQLLLRGSVLDVYSGNDTSRGEPWKWYRSQSLDAEAVSMNVEPETSPFLATGAPEIYRQEISLKPTGTNKLFAIAGPVRFSSRQSMRIFYSEADGVIETDSALRQPLQYTVISSGQLGSDGAAIPTDSKLRSVIDPDIVRYARRPEVSGVDATGKSLADYALAGDHSYDQKIAANIEHHLRTTFEYTLDLTNTANFRGQDPMSAFLTGFKKGHCEYFAGAMTLMCQGLGIPARYVVGFRCEPEDFNTLGNYFIVKHSNAHAWCEIFTGAQWQTYDPTSGRGAVGGSVSYIDGLKKFFDFLEYKWASGIVAYDGQNQQNFLETLNYQISHAAVSRSGGVETNITKFRNWISDASFLGAIIEVMCFAAAFAALWFLIDRWRLRRRVKRIGLSDLPSSERFRLARQLEFYDDLLRILERHKIFRPPHLTPLEFSKTLSYLPSGAFDDIYRLTGLFYRIRYGPARKTPFPRRSLANVLTRIQATLNQSSQIPTERAAL